MKCYCLPYILRINGEREEGFYNCLPLQMGGGGGGGVVGGGGVFGVGGGGWGLLERRGFFELGGGALQ